jgi:hypothetical protein
MQHGCKVSASHKPRRPLFAVFKPERTGRFRAGPETQTCQCAKRISCFFAQFKINYGLIVGIAIGDFPACTKKHRIC